MKAFRVLIAILAFVVSTAFAQTEQVVTVIHTNDLHGMMMPFDYPGSLDGLVPAAADMGGLARRATLIDQLRAAAHGPCVVIDAGDIFTRGPWHPTHFGAPEVEVMNRIGYDMMTVGNNEFKALAGVESQAVLLQRMRESSFPWLAANLTVGATGVPVEGIHPFVVRRFGALKIAFLGLTAPRAAGYPQTAGWTISDPIDAARRWIPEARRAADVVIAVTHIGVDVNDAASTMALDRRLAAEVDGIDAIVGGDSHTFLDQPFAVVGPSGRTVPIVQAGELGVRVGVIELTFAAEAETWRLVSYAGRLVPVDSQLAEDEGVRRYLDEVLPAVRPIRPYLPGEFLDDFKPASAVGW